ncbi:unnamed protein product [Orchesella dallaii]|uniref:Uncharacterized protein n=1 Tax=Orchesella dallaii TaxID=48710 RepID=A0ABP1R5X2_9HEXA
MPYNKQSNKTSAPKTKDTAATTTTASEPSSIRKSHDSPNKVKGNKEDFNKIPSKTDMENLQHKIQPSVTPFPKWILGLVGIPTLLAPMALCIFLWRSPNILSNIIRCFNCGQRRQSSIEMAWVEVSGKTAAQKAALGKILNYKPTRQDVPPPCPTDFTVPILSMEMFGINVEPQSRHKRCRTTSANDYSSAIPSTSTEACVQQSLRNAGPVDNTTEVVESNFHNHSLNSLLLQQNSLVTQLSSGITTQLATENRNVSDTSVPDQFNQVDTEISAENRVLLSLNELQLGDHSTTCDDVRTSNSDSRDSSGLSQAEIMILPPNTTSLELCDETEVTFEGEQNREADTSLESSYELIFEDQNMCMFLDGNQFLNHLDGAETDPVDVLLTTNEELDYNDFGNTLTIARRPADEGYQCANVTYDDISQITLDSPQPGSTFTLEGRSKLYISRNN